MAMRFCFVILHYLVPEITKSVDLLLAGLRDRDMGIVVVDNDVFIEDAGFAEKVEREYRAKPFAMLGPDIYSPCADVHQNRSNFRRDRTKCRRMVISLGVLLKIMR